jgi:hypothetical protein
VQFSVIIWGVAMMVYARHADRSPLDTIV